MDQHAAPALVPCAALVAGAALVHAGLTVSSPGLLVLLLALGIALGGPAGRALAGLALGLLLGLGAGTGRATPGPVADLPVEVVGVVVDHPRPLGDDDWRLRLQLQSWRQGGRVQPDDRELWLELGGAGVPPRWGTRLRARGYWRVSEPLANGLPRRVGLPRLRVKSLQLVTIESDPGPLGRFSGALRSRLAAASPLAGNGLGAAFARALVLGDSSGIPVPVRQSLARFGLAHVLSVSGLHVGLVTALGLLLGRKLPRSLRGAPAVILVLLYLAAVGPLPPLLRSAGMAALAALALLAERPPVAANALALVAAGLVALDPRVVGELSFVLSLAATGGLVLVAPALLAGWRRGRSAVEPPGLGTRGLAVTLAAQLTTAPWTLPLFALLTPWAAVANLLAAPWVAAMLATSLLATTLGALSPALGALTVPMLAALAAPIQGLGTIPVSPWVALPCHLEFPLALVVAAGVGWALARPRRGLPILAAVVALGVVVASVRPSPAPLEIAILDVGQGDGVLLRDGSRAILLDGGGSLGGSDFGGRVLLPVLARFGVTRLEAVVVSHEDRDHCGGLVDLAGLMAIRQAAFTRGVADTSCGRALANAAPARLLAVGDEIVLGRWRLTVLHPSAQSAIEGNDGSLVIRAEAYGRRFLLTGDIEAAAERALIDADEGGDELAADVLKVAHHGSKSSSGERFLERVGARLAIVSAGRNNAFGHPAPGVLERLQRHGCKILRTDRDGAIVVGVSAQGRLTVTLPGGPK